MAKLVGTVTNISEQKVATNGNSYSTVSTTIGSFNVFDTGVLMKLEPDREYLIEYEQKGKFKNLIGFEPINKSATSYAEPVNPRANETPSGRDGLDDGQSGFTSLGNIMKNAAPVNDMVRPASPADAEKRVDCLNLVIDLISNCPAVLNNVFLSNNNAELGVKIAQTADVFNYYMLNGWDPEIRKFCDSLDKGNLDQAPEVIPGEEIEEQELEQKKLGED